MLYAIVRRSIPFALAVLAGCAAKSTTAPNVTPDYSGSHYNGAVNSGGSGVGTNNPAVNGAVSGGMAGPLGPGSSGTSDQSGGSGSPSGATGSAGAGNR